LGFGSFLCNLIGVNIVKEFCCLKECKVHFIYIDSEGRAKWEGIGVLSLAVIILGAKLLFQLVCVNCPGVQTGVFGECVLVVLKVDIVISWLLLAHVTV